MEVIPGNSTEHSMLSPTALVYGNLASATSRALAGLQRSVGRLLEGEAAQKLLDKGDAGQHVYASRLDSEVKVKQAQITSLQNTVSFSHAQEAALSAAESVFNRMCEIAVRATDTMLTAADRRNLDLEFNELRNFSNEIGEEKMLGNELFGGSQLDGYTSIEANGPGHSNLLLQSHEGSKLYFKPTWPYSEIIADPWQFGIVPGSGAVQGLIQINARVGGISLVNFEATDFIYEDTNGKFWEADLAGKELLSPVQVTFSSMNSSDSGVMNLPQFADASDLNLLTAAKASSAVTTLNSYVEQLGEQKATLGANLSELELSMERLSRQVFAGKVSLERMTDEEMAEDLVRVSHSTIVSDTNAALLAQAKHINEN